MRLFVAVWPSEEVLDTVAALPRPEVKNLRWTTHDQWHITLRFLGAVDDPDEAVSALGRLRAARCEAVLGSEVRRLGSRVLMVPVAGLDEIAAEVIAATAEVGEPPEDRPFKGHLTLARARGRVDFRPLAGHPITGRWPVDEVTLVESRLHPKGARYETIARVPLQ